jgi:hypothetical protein
VHRRNNSYCTSTQQPFAYPLPADYQAHGTLIAIICHVTFTRPTRIYQYGMSESCLVLVKVGQVVKLWVTLTEMFWPNLGHYAVVRRFFVPAEWCFCLFLGA